ncbi:MAG: SpoIIE family protein phosphatase [Planctomycetota bacterium]
MPPATLFAAESRALTVLEVRQDGRLLRSVPVRKDAIVIGRRAGVDCRLEHETVSRLHAVIYRDRGGPWRIRDLGSHNGTFLGSRRIDQELLAPNASASVGVFELRLVRRLSRSAQDHADQSTSTDDATRAHRASFDHDRTASLVRAAREAEVGEDYRAQLQDLAKRVRVLESTPSRRRALCDFLTRCPELDAVAAMIAIGARHDHPEAFRVATASPRVEANDAPAFGLSVSLVRRVLSEWKPIRGAAQSEHADVTITSLGFKEAKQIIACPLSINADETTEILLAAVGHEADDSDLQRIALAAQRYAKALEEAADLDLREEYKSYRDQLRVAEQIQRSLLPSVPHLPGLDVALVSTPSERVSGDYLDAFAIDEHRSLIFLADVTGHGLAAAIVAAQIHTMVHAHPWHDRTSLPEFVRGVSRYLCQFTPDNITVTALALVFDKKSRTIELVNAGHHPVVLVRPGEPPTPTRTGANALLGLAQLAEDPIETERLHLEPQTWVVGYSDGIPEQRDVAGRFLGHAGAAQIIASALSADAKQTADDAVKSIGVDLDAHQGLAHQSDDRSLFVLRASDTC